MAYAVTEADGNATIYFGADRYGASGDSSVGFWFLKNEIGILPDGTFSGAHADGDILLLLNFGSQKNVYVMKWENDELIMVRHIVNEEAICNSSDPNQVVCAIANEDKLTNVPWLYNGKEPNGGNRARGATAFIEGGININHLFDETDGICFLSFLVS